MFLLDWWMRDFTLLLSFEVGVEYIYPPKSLQEFTVLLHNANIPLIAISERVFN
jgi:hypothetical protein